MCLLPERAKMARLRMTPFGNGRCRETACTRITAAELYKYRSDVGASVTPRTCQASLPARVSAELRCLEKVDGFVACTLFTHLKFGSRGRPGSGKSCTTDFMPTASIAK